MTLQSLAERSSLEMPASPLAMLVRDQRTNRLLAQVAGYLDRLRAAKATATNGDRPKLALSLAEVNYAREQWETGVLSGEQRLYDLATLLAQVLLGTERLQRVARIVAGPKEEEESTGEARIVIEETISRERLQKTTDFGLTHAIASRYRYRRHEGGEYGKLYARASFLEMRPLQAVVGTPVTRVLTRVKANAALWNKVTDALFDVDRLVKRDKILNARSKYIKDVFGIKVLIHHKEDTYQVEDAISGVCFGAEALAHLGLPPEATQLQLIERKDYLGDEGGVRKDTGWEAVKNVYQWCGHVFEIQIQTEANYALEVWDLSDTSHRTFEMQRRRLRRELEEKIPHYRAIRRLLKSLFGPDDDPERLDGFDWVELAP
jgi:hypothetical protein